MQYKGKGYMTENTYNVLKPENGAPIKAWTKGVPLEDAARQQLLNVAQLPFIYKWVAAMPDVHWGIGATVGRINVPEPHPRWPVFR
jgi:tRNA-splicing ligase RtcB